MELAQGSIGSVGKYEVEFKGGNLVASESASLGASSETLQVVIAGADVEAAVVKKIPVALQPVAKIVLDALLAI